MPNVMQSGTEFSLTFVRKNGIYVGYVIFSQI